jgi:hypothetical protein
MDLLKKIIHFPEKFNYWPSADEPLVRLVKTPGYDYQRIYDGAEWRQIVLPYKTGNNLHPPPRR